MTQLDNDLQCHSHDPGSSLTHCMEGNFDAMVSFTPFYLSAFCLYKKEGKGWREGEKEGEKEREREKKK